MIPISGVETRTYLNCHRPAHTQRYSRVHNASHSSILDANEQQCIDRSINRQDVRVLTCDSSECWSGQRHAQLESLPRAFAWLQRPCPAMNEIDVARTVMKEAYRCRFVEKDQCWIGHEREGGTHLSLVATARLGASHDDSRIESKPYLSWRMLRCWYGARSNRTIMSLQRRPISDQTTPFSLANRVKVSMTDRCGVSQSNCGQKPISMSRF